MARREFLIIFMVDP